MLPAEPSCLVQLTSDEAGAEWVTEIECQLEQVSIISDISEKWKTSRTFEMTVPKKTVSFDCFQDG